MLLVQASYRIVDSCVSYTTRGILSFPTTPLVHHIIHYVGHSFYIIEVFLSVKLVGYHDLVACRAKASGSLGSAVRMLWGCVQSPQFHCPWCGVQKVSLTDPCRVVPKIVPPLPAYLTIYTVFHELTPRKQLLNADEFRHMCFCSIAIPLIMCIIEIINYVQYLVRVSSQIVLDGSHIAQMLYLSVLRTRLTVLFATFVRHASRERSTGRSTSLALTNGFLIRGFPLLVRETLLAPKTSYSRRWGF